MWVDPITGEAFYVGKGKRNRHIQRHTYQNGKKTRSQLKRDKLKKQGYGDCDIVHLVVTEVSNIWALKEERILIREYGRSDLGEGSLYNNTDGGEDRGMYFRSDKRKKKYI